MNGHHSRTIGFLLTSHPYRVRSPRSDVDFVLAAMAMDYQVEVYFLGHSILQLSRHRALDESGLPAGYRAWASLPEMGEFSVFAEQEWLHDGSEDYLLPVTGLNEKQMRDQWRRCMQSLVLQ